VSKVKQLDAETASQLYDSQ